MKLTINVDCTPDEARTFMGLPDVKPLQDEMMNIMRDKTLENLKLMEPDKMTQMWGSFMNQGMSQGMANMQDFFGKIMTTAASSRANAGAAKAKK